jgi:hypothetical protein
VTEAIRFFDGEGYWGFRVWLPGPYSVGILTSPGIYGGLDTRRRYKDFVWYVPIGAPFPPCVSQKETR